MKPRCPEKTLVLEWERPAEPTRTEAYRRQLIHMARQLLAEHQALCQRYRKPHDFTPAYQAAYDRLLAEIRSLGGRPSLPTSLEEVP